MENWDELDSFLKKVDQVDSILKGINSTDENVVKENMRKADKLIENKDHELEVDGIKTKTGVNKTLINKSEAPERGGDTSQDAFMSMLEKDAQERNERRKKNMKVASELKEKGNVEFREGRYEKAIEYYSEGIQTIKDMAVLYTNRAQAYIKLNKHDLAIIDCDWALRVDDKCVKALVHKGRALTYMKQFDKASEEFEKAKKLDTNSSAIDSFIKELNRCRLAYNQEQSAQLFLENTSKEDKESVNHFLDVLNTKLYKRDQSVMYYSGGIRYLASLCNNNLNHRVMFRTQKGFELFKSHFLISKYTSPDIKTPSLNHEECDLISSILGLVQAICHDNDENLRLVFETHGSFIEQLLNQGNTMIEYELVKLLLMISDMEFGREQLLANIKLKKLVDYLVDSLNRLNDPELTESMINILENLSLDSKFQSKLQTDDVQTICQIIKNTSKYSTRASSLAFTTVYALTNQQSFRSVIVKQDHIWQESLKIIKSKKDDDVLLKLVLSLLVNLGSIQSDNLTSRAYEISESLLRVYNTSAAYRNQVLSSLSNFLQKSQDPARILSLFDQQFVQAIAQNIKIKEDLEHQSMKLLALCTQNDKKFCRMILDIDPKLAFLYAMFKDVHESTSGQLENTKVNIKKLNEPLLNNCILCMSHCVDSDDGVLATNLTQTNIIMDLLYLARDGFNREMQKNSGILISKLVKKNEKHLIRLRELHGVEILYSALKDKI